MSYLLDADVLISAKRLYYGFDFCPAFWDWIIEKNKDQRVFSVEKVGDEVLGSGDELTEWAKERGEGFFLKPDESTFPSFAVLSAWVTGRKYEQSAISTFLQAADYYLVAQAHAKRHIVVTREVPSGSTRKIKIPDAAIGVGVKCMTPFEMLRIERARFILER